MPKNLKLVAVPLFEMYDNLPRFGLVISTIPLVVSRLRLILAGSNSTLAIMAPPAAEEQNEVYE